MVIKNKIKENLNGLEKDPYHKRSGADIRKLVGTHPVLYRLRVGNYRVVYTVEGDNVWITEIFHRKRVFIDKDCFSYAVNPELFTGSIAHMCGVLWLMEFLE